LNEGDALPSVERIITQDRIGKYAAASGDFNPIHIDEAFAAESQFGGTIAHGMLVAATISEVMSSAFGQDWLESGRLKLRFKAPVFPGDTVTAYGAVKAVREGEGAGEVVCSVGVRRQTGEDAITGEARVRVRPLA
jgi:3-hydroxybutyryl-CoA dehydratase